MIRPMRTSPIHLAILASGGGTTLQNLLDQIDVGRLNAKIRLVIASRPGATAIDRATRAGIPAHVIDRKQYPSAVEFSQPVFRLIDEAKIDLICLAGWLSMIEVPAR